MSENLVIVESPAKAKTIQKFLGNGFIVKSSFGHIRDLQSKKLSIDINDGFKPEYVIPASKKKIVAELKKAAEEAKTVWLASDEDREGEAISWHLCKTLDLDEAATRRIVFHEITKDAILKAIENPRPLDHNLVNAQQARRVLDRLVGFELSPILWRKIQRGLSAGRVQSVALRLVVDREREINNFHSNRYYKVEAVFNTADGKVKGTLDKRFDNMEEAREFLVSCIGAEYSVTALNRKEGSRFPSAPFTTSTLQQEAAKKLHLPVNITMRLAQSLYERGLITYMRTDSTNLSSLALGTAKQFIIDNFGQEYSHPRQYKTNAKGAQEAHEAIRPTFISNTGIEGTAQEKKLYDLIWKRTLASQMAEAKILNTTVTVGMDNRSETYSIQATEIRFDGYLKVYMDTSDEGESDGNNAIIPALGVGDAMKVSNVNAECKFTQPPLRYSEASLVKKLEELGIGRPSTYAPTISTLTTGRGYLVKGDKEGVKKSVTNLTLKGSEISEVTKTETIGAEKGKLLPQDIGMIVTDYLVNNFSDIIDYDFTAKVEKDFDSIAEGQLKWNDVISAFYSPFHLKVDNAINDRQYSHVERVLGTDPADGRTITAKFGQFGPFVQKGEGKDRQCASLAKGQLIETLTMEEALALFQLPRIVGQYQGVDVVAMKGRFGPYLKHGSRNVSLPRGTDPVAITLEKCISLLEETAVSTAQTSVPILKYDEADIAVINGRFGPYIKHAGANYKIPKNTDAASLTLDGCRRIIEAGPTSASGKYKRFKKK